MTREEAFKKWERLGFMTVERGCFPDEAATAKEMRDRLGSMWGFSVNGTGAHQETKSNARTRWEEYVKRTQRPRPQPTPAQKKQWDYDYEAARRRWKWEGRKCGKADCWCSHQPGTHGPYRYAKVRTGRHVASIYLGRGK